VRIEKKKERKRERKEAIKKRIFKYKKESEEERSPLLTLRDFSNILHRKGIQTKFFPQHPKRFRTEA
jgi:hypothetical protein